MVAALVTAIATAGAVACATGGPDGAGGQGGTPEGSGAEDLGNGAPASDALVREVAPFPITGPDGSPYEFPFLGGLEVPRIQFVDIDGDSDFDLFLQQRADQLAFFENVGSSAEARFVWRTDRYRDLSVGDWSRFIDLDGDGDLDLLTEERFSYIRAYENLGNRVVPEFELRADSIRGSDGTPIFSDRQNIPFIVDLDCDGALDLFLGRIDGTVSRLEAPGPGTPGDAPTFDLVTDRFEDIEIVAQLVGGGGASLHGANSMVFTDLDRDGDLDLLWGDFFEPGLLFIENVGNCYQPNLRVEPVPLPAEDTVETSGYNASALADLDGDGSDELFVGVLGGAYNPVASAVENFHLYREQGDGTFDLVTRSYLTNWDVGNETIPALGDVDGDGDLDLLVGAKVDPGATSDGRLHYLENTGSPTAPHFTERGPMPLSEIFHQAPALGDLDGDGDLDLMLGDWRSGVAFWRNEGAEGIDGIPRFSLVDSSAIELPRGSNTVPALGDLDGDGDLDLLVGESAGNLNFYRNVGSVSAPRFELETEDFLDLDVGRRSAPSFEDWDGDGDLDLFVGSETGQLLLLLNSGTGTSPSFSVDEAFAPTLPPYSAASWGDLDGDGDRDLLTGGVGGGLQFFRRGG